MLRYNATSENITYDENGNMTSVTNSCGTTTYTWDVRNRLASINGFKPDCSSLTASFKYDALGRRIEKTINGVTTKYLYDGLDIIQEKNQSGTITANYIRSLNIDEPLVRLTTTSIRHYKTDALGSVIALLDDAGTVKTTYTYDPFGNVTISGEASDNPFQYTGRENDNTGLYYYRARYYSPELQRFISEDPIGFKSGDVNFYTYIKNQPINWVDPLGLFCIQIWSTTTGYQFDIYRTEWRLEGEKVIRAGIAGYCYWGKYEVGWMRRYIKLYYLCCENCGCYIKTEEKTDYNKHERRIDTTTTGMKWFPMGPYHMWRYECIHPDDWWW